MLLVCHKERLRNSFPTSFPLRFLNRPIRPYEIFQSNTSGSVVVHQKSTRSADAVTEVSRLNLLLDGEIHLGKAGSHRVKERLALS